MTKQEMINLIQKLIETGEKIDVEFKESKDNLNKDVYESLLRLMPVITISGCILKKSHQI